MRSGVAAHPQSSASRIRSFVNSRSKRNIVVGESGRKCSQSTRRAELLLDLHVHPIVPLAATLEMLTIPRLEGERREKLAPDYDAIVVGAANAGFAAAVSASGGDTCWSDAAASPSMIRWKLHRYRPRLRRFEDLYSGSDLCPGAKYLADLMRTASEDSDPELVNILASNSKDIAFWMREGVPWSRRSMSPA